MDPSLPEQRRAMKLFRTLPILFVLGPLLPVAFARAQSESGPDTSPPPASASSAASPADASGVAVSSEGETKAPISSASEGWAKSGSKANVTWSGYVEAFYQYNVNDPSNGITNFRGFDNRHNSFTLANVVLDTQWALDRMSGRLAIQYGHTPESYYSSEPTVPGANGAGGSSSNVWKFVQQANIGWKAPLGRGLLLEAGVFLSPIGPEGMAIKDQWNWSRSNLFFGLPFYHTGARATYQANDEISLTAHVYNGWNSVVDGNRHKSAALSITYNKPDRVLLQVSYFGGNERPTGAVEGAPWRHLFDAYAVFAPHERLQLMVHGNGGFERNRFGTSSWYAGALYARVKLVSWLFLAARGDHFQEKTASNAEGSATSIFWPTRDDRGSVTSGTATLDARPMDNVSFRLEYRHDEGRADMFFRRNVPTDATSGAFVANARRQDTLTFGAVTWF